MKVRLLKKIRKRFTITKVTKLSSNPGHFIKEYVKDWGLPLYIMEDTRDPWAGREYSKTYEQAVDNILVKIRRLYSEKFKSTKEESHQVWWSKKQNK